MRPIDADYIRGALEAELCREDDGLEDRQWAYGYAAGVDLAICKLAEALTLTPQDEWVSVEDSVPDPGERVLATDGIFVGESYRTSANTWCRHTGFPWRDCLQSIVTHWRPIPAPPGKETQP